MSQRTVAIIQARMASSRLPGKVLLDLGGRSVLGWMVRRVNRAKQIDEIVIATTENPEDDAIVQYCRKSGISYYRGSMSDVLDRVYQTAKYFQADIIVRLTGDCPFIDPHILDDDLNIFKGSDPPLDFAANRLPPPYTRTSPIGLDAEYCTFVGLEKVWKEAKAKYQREHVMPYFYENPERFNVLHIERQPDYSHMRWTLDTIEDLKLLRWVVNQFEGRDDFLWLEVVALMEQHPEMAQINVEVRHKDYREVDERT
jgi:spore coat polysaccharide biosynthesis protein SpsF